MHVHHYNENINSLLFRPQRLLVCPVTSFIEDRLLQHEMKCRMEVENNKELVQWINSPVY